MADARLTPGYGRPTYAVRAPLVRWLEAEARRAHEELGPYRLLDIGCGQKPYAPLFAPYASAYVGVDPVENPHAELRGTIEDLPVEDGAYDVVLCSQVLEHCDDPAQAVRELARVTAPGGRVLLSTHGVMMYHPSPADYWRWTHAGLERLFRTNADWASVTVMPASGTTACIAMLISLSVDLLAQRLHARRLTRPLVAGINWTAERIDRAVPALGDGRPGTLAANYHVVAERRGAA
jgi:SAM-dependent methyltransferase